MLKRCQVLLEDWQVEFMQNRAKKYDMSFSEVFRIFFCLGTLYTTTAYHPEYKPGTSIKELAERMTKASKLASPEAESHKIISQIYYEGRKAAEYRAKEDKLE